MDILEQFHAHVSPESDLDIHALRDDPDSLEQINGKVKDMIEAFRRQLKEQTECIDKEKSALNQFISGLVKDEKAQSPRKLKAMSF